MLESIFENNFVYMIMLALVPLMALALIKGFAVVAPRIVDWLAERRQRKLA